MKNAERLSSGNRRESTRRKYQQERVLSEYEPKVKVIISPWRRSINVYITSSSHPSMEERREKIKKKARAKRKILSRIQERKPNDEAAAAALTNGVIAF